MDNFILKNQVILKIDTEGYEYKILKGLSKKHLERIDFILLSFKVPFLLSFLGDMNR